MTDVFSVPFSHRCCQKAPRSDSDLRLLSGLREGFEGCYAELLVRIQRVVAPLAAITYVGPNDKDDLIQNVALKVFLRLPQFRGECAFNTWIYQIAINELRDSNRWFVRHRVREVGGLEAKKATTFEPKAADHLASPFSWTAEREWHAELASALTMLSPIYRHAILLRGVAELTYSEIAEHLGVSVPTVKSRIFSARQQLRANLQNQRRFGVARGAFNCEPR